MNMNRETGTTRKVRETVSEAKSRRLSPVTAAPVAATSPVARVVLSHGQRAPSWINCCNRSHNHNHNHNHNHQDNSSSSNNIHSNHNNKISCFYGHSLRQLTLSPQRQLQAKHPPNRHHPHRCLLHLPLDPLHLPHLLHLHLPPRPLLGAPLHLESS